MTERDILDIIAKFLVALGVGGAFAGLALHWIAGAK